LWVQMLGRGTRPAPWVSKENCIVFDFTSNTQRLGAINDPVIPKKPNGKKRTTPGLAPVKTCPKCSTWNPTQTRFCGGFPHPTIAGCGFEFPVTAKIGLESSGLPVMKLTEDQITVLELDISNVIYRRHEPRNVSKPPSLMVTYFCQGPEKVEKFREYICFEHAGLARTKAETWWRERYPDASLVGAPITVQDAEQLTGFLRIPTKLRVWLKEPYSEILGYVY